MPVFKYGYKDDFNNYRPISLLSSFSKLFEKIVASQLVRFLNSHDILYKYQFRFRAKHKTIQPVLHFTEQIYKSLNQKTSAKPWQSSLILKKLLTQ